MPKVYCTVNNCHYWGSGNLCMANEILVTNDQLGATAGDFVDAPMAGSLSSTPTQTCMETCCKTFAVHGSPQSRSDRVTRRR